MTTIVDQFGHPIDRGALREPQTSRIATLQNQYLAPMLGGLTPAKVAGYLRAADDGDLTGQHRLFADMEERDPHLTAEMGKRKLAVLGLDWEITPPRNATPAEEKAAEWAEEVLRDSVIPFEDLVLSLMEGVGHGFAATELEWRPDGSEWLPIFNPRPQEWFRLSQNRRELRLQDAAADGAPLQPFGWVLHTHGTAKTGYLGRMGLYRCLVWPFLYKVYSVGDFAEFLETYGLPIIVGKYYQGADAEARSSLLRAVTALGHDARAIMPADMELEIQKVTGSGDGTPHMTMIDWADKSQSKAILGATLTSQADGKTSTNALGNVHNEVRHDILEADAREIAATITRDLVYPLIALNIGGIDGLRRCPRLVFDTGEAEDLAQYADALPKLVDVGLEIPVSYVHDKLRIPQREDGEAVLSRKAQKPEALPGRPALDDKAPQGEAKPPAAPATLTALRPGATVIFPDQAALDAAADQTLAGLASAAEDFMAPVIAALEGAADYADAFERLAVLWPQLDSREIERRLGNALTVAEAWGRLTAEQ